LPASPKIGDVVQLKDYARTWGTNAVSIASTTFDGASNNPSFSTEGQTVTLVYMDDTKGWSLINEDTTTGLGAQFISATGGTVATSGDYKIHTFTGDGCFVVSCGGNPGGSDTVDYLVVAGGGGGGRDNGGGGGAGGFRASSTTFSIGCAPGAPLTACVSALPVSATTYPVTVGAGGPGGSSCTPVGAGVGEKGSDSVFSTITSAGGGGGGTDGNDPESTPVPQTSGGSGGGTAQSSPTGPVHPASANSGNTPPVSPPQGNDGGRNNGSPAGGSGGGGAIAAGIGCNSSADGRVGGNGAGLPTAFGSNGESCGSYRYYAGGGGGGAGQPGSGTGGNGGLGGGANGGPNTSTGSAGTANTGGGGGGGGQGVPNNGVAAGGKGIVVIRYKFQ
jgi:hypothetical protein